MNTDSPIHIFGEVLFDCFPDGQQVLGGAPFNVAWHLQAFGQKPDLISRIGNDSAGRTIAGRMRAWNMSLANVQTDDVHPTGKVQVQLVNGEPGYDIVANSAYDFIQPPAAGSADTQGIFYHGSLALRNPVSAAALAAYKARHHGKIFVDINLRPPWWQKDGLTQLLQDAAWVKLNVAELADLGFTTKSLEPAMLAFQQEFGLDILIVTRGAQGAAALDNQRNFHYVSPAPALTVVDTVGAGDAFASVILLGLLLDWPLGLTLNRAQDFAGALVGQRGATVEDINFYQSFRRLWL